MNEKKPQAGEFWEWAGERLRIIGTRNDGRIVGENQAGGLEISCHIFDMTPLPDCDSFDWQPETFPQWYIHGTDEWPLTSYVKRTSHTEYEMYNPDGTFHRPEVWQEAEQRFVADGKWKQVTQAEAESRVKNPEQVESPDDWVTQDRVPARPVIDQWRWSYHDGENSGWCESRDGQGRFEMHGTIEGGDIFEVRCRRRDLPPMPQETPRREYVRLWFPQPSGPIRVTQGETLDGEIWAELKHDGTGFYLEDGK